MDDVGAMISPKLLFAFAFDVYAVPWLGQPQLQHPTDFLLPPERSLHIYQGIQHGEDGEIQRIITTTI